MTRVLSPRTTVDLLKQEARRWLSALRAGDTDARQRLVVAWPTAPEAPVLRDVQHALAREYDHTDWKTLCAAVEDLALDRQRHEERVRLVLEHGWSGDAALARRLVQRAPVISRDSIFTAALCGDRDEVARRLVRNPSLAQALDPHRQWTALAHVAYGRVDDHNALAIATLLLDAGADPNFRFDDGWGNPFTPITGAIGQGEGNKRSHPQARALVELLLDRGANPFDTQALYNSSIVGDDITWTALLWERCVLSGTTAVWSSTTGQVLGGREKVGTLNYLLGNAVSNNHVQRARWLLAHGASATTVHAYSRQPVHTEARLRGFTELTLLLEQHGAVAEALSGERALVAALMRGDDADVRQRVGNDPALLRRPGPLIAAARHGSAPAIRLLLSLGADVRTRDHEGVTALHRAAESGAVSAIDALLEAGAEIDARDPRWQGTPLEWACVLGRHAVAEQLAVVSRDVRAFVRSGRIERLKQVLHESPELAQHHLPQVAAPTPLFCLPTDDEVALDIVQLLRAHGADLLVRDREGRTAAQVARARGLDAAADAIESASS
jgi:uncharacterized protein